MGSRHVGGRKLGQNLALGRRHPASQDAEVMPGSHLVRGYQQQLAQTAGRLAGGKPAVPTSLGAQVAYREESLAK